MLDISGVIYEKRANYVGEDRCYYRASGTSFAAPIVTGVASLMLSKNPELTAVELGRILRQTAEDVDVPGVDQFSGYGIVNAVNALHAEPDFYVRADIDGVEVVQSDKGLLVKVLGTADASDFRGATVSIGRGETPRKWKDVLKVNEAVSDGVLGEIDANLLRGAEVWTIRLVVKHRNGKTREMWYRLNLG